MCGTAGIFNIAGINAFLATFKAANDIIQHRGPDGHGYALFNTRGESPDCFASYEAFPDMAGVQNINLALGHRRLAIIDLSETGRQPMTNADRSLWIVYNGEVYNYIELRAELEQKGHVFHSHSDTEVILQAYDEWGEECVSRFNGIWAFAIADLKSHRLFCSRDRFGVKPFHYFSDGKNFVFSSEIKQAFCFPFVSRRVNHRAAYEYLAYGAVEYCEETFFEDIYRLLQGHNLVVNLKDGTFIISRYYNPALSINRGITYNEAAQEFRRLFSDSISLQLRSDVEVGSCLSGGLDSSSIVCVVNQQLKNQGKDTIQRTFSSHFDDKDANELEYMQEAIRHTGVRADFIYPRGEDLRQDLQCLVWHQDEPFGSTSIFAQWSVFKLVHQNNVKVMLDGQGADEQLAGYMGFSYIYLKELFKRHRYARLTREMWRHALLQRGPWLSFGWNYLLKEISKALLPEQTLGWINPTLVKTWRGVERSLEGEKIQPFGNSEILNNNLYQRTFINNLQSLLRHEDRNSMAFSVEARVPFLDHRLVEFVFSLPSDFKIHDGYSKSLMRDGMECILPEKIRWRTTKLGFATPERTWQHSILRPLLEEVLQDEKMRAFIVPERTRKHIEGILRQNVIDWTMWRCINLSLWMKCYNAAI